MNAGRPRTPIGSWGTITTRPVSTGHEARAYLRGLDGRRRLISARGPTPAKARNRLQTRLADQATSTRTVGAKGITPNTTIRELCERWIEGKKQEDVTRQTIDDYTATLQGPITGRIGDLTLREATPGRIATFLDSLTPGVRHRARSILIQAFRLAKAHDAITGNPVEGLPTSPEKKHAVEVLTLEQLVELRAGIGDWIAGRIGDDGTLTPPGVELVPRADGLAEFVDLLLATGCRTSELAAVRWCDLNLEATPATMTIDATMVRLKGDGLIRQEWRKAKTGLVVTLPPFAVQTIAEMFIAQHRPGGDAPLFPSQVGTHRDPGNIRKQWRAARKAAGGEQPGRWEWVQFRTMRRTVATLIDQLSSDEDAAAQLGNSVTVARRHYIAARAAQAPDLSGILQRLAG